MRYEHSDKGIPHLSTRSKCVISFTLQPLYPQGRGVRYPLDRWLGGLKARLNMITLLLVSENRPWNSQQFSSMRYIGCIQNLNEIREVVSGWNMSSDWYALCIMRLLRRLGVWYKQIDVEYWKSMPCIVRMVVQHFESVQLDWGYFHLRQRSYLIHAKCKSRSNYYGSSEISIRSTSDSRPGQDLSWYLFYMTPRLVGYCPVYEKITTFREVVLTVSFKRKLQQLADGSGLLIMLQLQIK
jgi:hypothetical protein